MNRDALEDMPEESRAYVVREVQRLLDVNKPLAEEVVRASEPLWNAMEDAGGLVDSWGGGEFTVVLPAVLNFIRTAGWRKS